MNHKKELLRGLWVNPKPQTPKLLNPETPNPLRGLGVRMTIEVMASGASSHPEAEAQAPKVLGSKTL